jgi:arginyl-tRNA synthetase
MQSLCRTYAAAVGCAHTWHAVVSYSASVASSAAPRKFHHPSERELAIAIVQLPDVIANAVETLQPHVLCDHTHQLAQRFHAFYAACRIVDASVSPDAVRDRVALCAAADAALRTSFNLLGIVAMDRL